MPDLLLNFACPLILSAAYVYAATVNVRHRWRTQRRLPPRHRTPLTEARRRLIDEAEAYNQMRRDAEQIVTDAYERIASLYEQPTSERADH